MTTSFCTRVTDNTLWAVEFDTWKPNRAAGPLTPKDLSKEPGSFTMTVDAKLWNVRFLVKVCPRERQLLIDGTPRGAVLVARTGNRL